MTERFRFDPFRFAQIYSCFRCTNKAPEPTSILNARAKTLLNGDHPLK